MIDTHSSMELGRDWKKVEVARERKSSRVRTFLKIRTPRRLSKSLFIILFGLIFSSCLIVSEFGSSRLIKSSLSSIPFFKLNGDRQWGLGRTNWTDRAERVKESFLHAYHGYEHYAAPMDELLPITNGSVNNFNGWGVTIVDALDTMYIMGLKDEFARGVRAAELTKFNTDKLVPFFETAIRYLGGYLSAYALSGDHRLLELADELGAALLPVFATPSGFPSFSVNPLTRGTSAGFNGEHRTGWLAEIASCMMEYKYLAKLTGKKKYYDVANNIMERLYQADVSSFPDGLLPSKWDLETGQPLNDQITIGAMADSAYEYFLKQYLLTNQTDTQSLDIYLRTMRGIMDNNMFFSPTRSFVYVTDISARDGTPSRKFEHLSCFLPGLLALGAHRLPPSDFAKFSEVAVSGMTPPEYERHVWAAQGLALGCATMYEDTATGLGADEVIITTLADLERDLGEEFGTPKNVNQTLEDIQLRWGNVIDAWRAGRYDGVRNEYIDLQDPEHNAQLFGNMWKAGSRDVKLSGPVPGLRDPPLPPWEDGDFGRDYKSSRSLYMLRPETIESYFIMWRTTKNPIWRQRGWNAFVAIETQLKTPSGYATMRDVFSNGSELENEMPSFFLAETLKYLYLLFSDDSTIPLDEYVFNTEAHPFPVFEWTEEEKQKFLIS